MCTLKTSEKGSTPQEVNHGQALMTLHQGRIFLGGGLSHMGLNIPPKHAKKSKKLCFYSKTSRELLPPKLYLKTKKNNTC